MKHRWEASTDYADCADSFSANLRHLRNLWIPFSFIRVHPWLPKKEKGPGLNKCLFCACDEAGGEKTDHDETHFITFLSVCLVISNGSGAPFVAENPGIVSRIATTAANNRANLNRGSND